MELKELLAKRKEIETKIRQVENDLYDTPVKWLIAITNLGHLYDQLGKVTLKIGGTLSVAHYATGDRRSQETFAEWKPLDHKPGSLEAMAAKLLDADES